MATTFQSTHTIEGIAPAGVVTIENAISAGGGSGIYDGSVQLDGGPKLDIYFTVTYTTEEDERIVAFETMDAEGDPVELMPSPEKTLLEIAVEWWNAEKPVGKCKFISK